MTVSARHHGEITGAGLLNIQVAACPPPVPGHADLKEPQGFDTLQCVFLPFNLIRRYYIYTLAITGSRNPPARPKAWNGVKRIG